MPSAQDRKAPRLSPLSSLLFTGASGVGQQSGYHIDKVRAVGGETTKTQDADDVRFNSTAGGEQIEGQYLWKNAVYELERLSVAVDY